MVAATGYDMEDAMILNAAAVQRGLAHGSLYKTDAVDLAEEKGKQLVRSPISVLGRMDLLGWVLHGMFVMA